MSEPFAVTRASSSAGGGGAEPHHTSAAAVAYVEEVKRVFEDEKDKYVKFTKVILDFKAEKIDLAETIFRVKELFEGYPKLILGFDSVLSMHSRTSLPAKQLPNKQQAIEINRKIVRFAPDADRQVYVTAAVAAGGGPPQRPTKHDAEAYLMEVQDTLKDDEVIVDKLLQIMKDLAAQRIDPPALRTKVNSLLRGHRALILGFNAWLPEDYKIPAPADKHQLTKKQPEDLYEKAQNYLNKIKMRFQNNDHVYKEFLRIFSRYHRKSVSFEELHQEVVHLLAQHADLLDEFTCFLPDSLCPVSSVKTSSAPAAKLTSESEERPTGMTHVRGRSQKAGIKQLKRQKISPCFENDQAKERVRDKMTQDRIPSRLLKAQPTRKDKETQDNLIPQGMGDKAATKHSPHDECKDLHALQRLKHKMKSARQADELIRNRTQAREGGEGLQGLTPLLEEDKKFPKSALGELQAFVDKLKGRLCDPHVYQEFLKCLNMFSQQIITSSELQSLVVDILGKNSDLMNGFKGLLSPPKQLNCSLAEVFSRKDLDLGESTITKKRSKVQKEKQHEREQKDCELAVHNEHDQHERRKRKKDSCFLDFANEVPVRKFSRKGLAHTDTSSWEKCTPSYRLLPKSYPNPLSTHSYEVLNERWISVPSHSGKYSVKRVNKNRSEQILLECEDQRFELDMVVESTAATARRVNEMVECVQDPIFKQHMSTCALENHLSATSLRCIELMYGDLGLDIIDQLRKDTSKVLPVVLSRLWQKHRELSLYRVNMNKVWVEVHAKNYDKSLDHRSRTTRTEKIL